VSIDIRVTTLGSGLIADKGINRPIKRQRRIVVLARSTSDLSTPISGCLPPVSAAEGIERGKSERRGKELSLSTDLEVSQPDPENLDKRPWESWPLTIRYVIVRIAQAVSIAIAVGGSCAHH
jgi:hypothetical protein